MDNIISGLAEKYGLADSEKEELLAYTDNRFRGAVCTESSGTDYLRGWDRLFMLAEAYGAAEVINKKLCPAHPVEYLSPGTVTLGIYDSFAGKIPVICAGDEHDFEQLVTNIVHKGVRPENIEKTGASFVSGSTVRFMILSRKPYSNVPADELGADEKDWAERSMLIRRSHECTHFYTKQTFGIANNIIHDELMADFIGLYDAFGYYRADWFLRFMGIIEGSGRRFDVYTKDLSANVRAAVTELVVKAAQGLEEWQHTDGFGGLSDAERIKLMCAAGIQGMTEGRLTADTESVIKK